ncbi:Aste57867_23413 [Aphanomyces stellatus]|uniref:Aste57867_23413 protein n=1 Tax=Aphanomyces stellatus TaxID=120398 RepID=A0A485LS73_9STRA|nr:hypothetical protein As57867_023342 [Aphanomyces stellatus]VFU00059.1 Aste57867_23413 [Aphanomyces stellatus]
MRQVFAQLPSYNPFVGTFHHAPSAGNRGAAYFAGDIVFTPELEMRKKLRQNPFAGTFHALPGYYDPLHGLKQFRKVKETADGSSAEYVEVDMDTRNSEPNLVYLSNIDRQVPAASGRARSHSDSDMVFKVVTIGRPKKQAAASSRRRSSAADVLRAQKQQPKTRGRSKSHHHKPREFDLLLASQISFAA